MKKFIVTTTINPPTEALIKFKEIAHKDDWTLVIVGDKKTPEQAYEDFIDNKVIYLDPNFQANEYPKLSDILGWNTIQRRNIGFVFAYNQGADVIATVDDDNIPYENWGKNLLIGRPCVMDSFTSGKNILDPLQFTNNINLWHRGYPIQLLRDRHTIEYEGSWDQLKNIQADLWDGDPDIDAICRISQSPEVEFYDINPCTSPDIIPFNSQNTFLSRACFPHYMCLPFVGRMDDIWGAYLLQHKTGFRPVFNNASVYQARNEHDLTKDLEAEMLGYKYSLDFASGNFDKIPINPKTWEAYDIYRSYFK